MSFADHLLEVVPSVTVENQELVEALYFKALDHIREDRHLRRWVHVDGTGDVQLLRICPEGHSWQHQGAGAPLPRQARRLRGDGVTLVDIRAVRQVEVVRLGRAPWEDRDVVL